MDHGAAGAAAEHHGKGASGGGLGIQGLEGQAHGLVDGVADGFGGEQLEAPGLAQGLVAGLELSAVPGGGVEAQHHLGAVVLGEAALPGAAQGFGGGDPHPLGAVAVAHGDLLEGTGAKGLSVDPGFGLSAAHQGHLLRQGHLAGIALHGARGGVGAGHQGWNRHGSTLARRRQGLGRLQ